MSDIYCRDPARGSPWGGAAPASDARAWSEQDRQLERADRHQVQEAKTTRTPFRQRQTQKDQLEPFWSLVREAGAGDDKGRGECWRLPRSDWVDQWVGDDTCTDLYAGRRLLHCSLPCLIPSAVHARSEHFRAENSEKYRPSFARVTQYESTEQECRRQPR